MTAPQEIPVRLTVMGIDSQIGTISGPPNPDFHQDLAALLRAAADAYEEAAEQHPQGGADE
jgi:hypothetical protein